MLGTGNDLPGFNNALTQMKIIHILNLHINALHETKVATESSSLFSDK